MNDDNQEKNENEKEEDIEKRIKICNLIYIFN